MKGSNGDRGQTYGMEEARGTFPDDYITSGGNSERGFSRRLLFPQRAQTSEVPWSRVCQRCQRQALCRTYSQRRRSSLNRRRNPATPIIPPSDKSDRTVMTSVTTMTQLSSVGGWVCVTRVSANARSLPRCLLITFFPNPHSSLTGGFTSI